MTTLHKWIALSFIFLSACSSGLQEETLQQLRDRVSEDSDLSAIYAPSAIQPIWVNDDGLNEEGETFLEELDQVQFDALIAENYHLEEITALLSEWEEQQEPSTLISLEVLISKSFLKLGHDLQFGGVSPRKLSEEWKIEPRDTTDFETEALKELASGKGSVAGQLDELRPSSDLYRNLREQYQELIKSEIDFASFGGGEAIKPGETAAKVEEVRKRFEVITGRDLPDSDAPKLYDEALVAEVKHFQRLHGLNQDGVLGKEFWEAFGASSQDLKVKLAVNLERLKWLPDMLDTELPKVLVNIPAFSVDLLHGQDTVYNSRAVVGTTSNQTPAFTAKMSYLVFSPRWYIPEGIIKSETLPAIQKDKEYISKKNMAVLDGNGKEVDPSKVKWDKLNQDETLPYRIYQKPGKDNALGRVKFMFPNPYSIYIHDSPARSLYSKDERAFSHGCIRLEKPQEFAEVLLKEQEKWPTDSIASAMNKEDEVTVKLPEGPQVWIYYLTAWNNGGELHLREDIYGQDRKVAKLMGLQPDEKYY